jgi:putative hemolysin
MAEISILAARKTRLQELVHKGSRRASTALLLINNPDIFLSVLQLGVSIVRFLAGSIAIVFFADDLERLFGSLGVGASMATEIGLLAVILIVVYLFMLLGELLPKQLALNRPEQAISLLAPLVRGLSFLLSPIVNLLTLSTALVLKFFSIKPLPENIITEEEIKGLIEQGAQAGTFDEAEQEIIERALELSRRKVSHLMVPRYEVQFIDLKQSYQNNYQTLISSRHTYYPLVDGDLDTIVGIFNAKEHLYQFLRSEPASLDTCKLNPLFIPESMNALDLLERFRQTRNQIALIVDEYGNFQGLITLRDIMEGIVGNIPSFNQEASPSMIKKEDGSFHFDGAIPIPDLKENLQIIALPFEEEQSYQTLGGFIVTYLGRIPTTGDQFTAEHFIFEVAAMDGNRVDRVIVTPTPEQTHTGNEI